MRRGEIVGVAGLMGAGRTQLLEAIFGVYPPDSLSGSISLNGRAVRFASPQDAIREGLGLVAEDRKLQSLVLERSVTENTTLAALRQFVNRLRDHRPAERAAGRRAGRRGPAHQDARRSTPWSPTSAAATSRRSWSASSCCREIVLFLLDEPTRGIDVGAKAEIYQLVGELAQEGTSFLLVSSEMPELLAVCDRIYVLCDGRLTGEFERESFDQEAIMEAATRFVDDDRGSRREPGDAGGEPMSSGRLRRRSGRALAAARLSLVDVAPSRLPRWRCWSRSWSCRGSSRRAPASRASACSCRRHRP